MNQPLAFVKFLYEDVLKEQIDFECNIKMKKPGRMPLVRSEAEVERCWNSFTLSIGLAPEGPTVCWSS